MANFQTEELEGLSGDAQIAVRLAQSGCEDSAIGFLVGKMKAEGYASRVQDIGTGIQHWRKQMPQCWPQVDQQPKSSYGAWRESVGQAMASRRA